MFLGLYTVASLDSMGSYCVHGFSMILTGAQVVHKANGSFPNQWLLNNYYCVMVVTCNNDYSLTVMITSSDVRSLLVSFTVECVYRDHSVTQSPPYYDHLVQVAKMV